MLFDGVLQVINLGWRRVLLLIDKFLDVFGEPRVL